MESSVMEFGKNSIKLRGRLVRLDELGRVSLNDIHKVGNYSDRTGPRDWGALEVTKRFIVTAVSKNAGKSGILSKTDVLSMYCVKIGRNGGTWAHPIIALAYAKYLSPDLHYEVNEVFLRFKAGDAALADETLQRSSPEGNEWAGVRALSRAKRRQYTDTLKAHGVEGFGYAQCTDETYKVLFGETAKKLKEAKRLTETANLRDNMKTDELVYVMAAEVLASGRIQEEKSEGNRECRLATGKSAGFIRHAIEADKADRKPRLV
jgi:hypothetical protein